MGMATKAPCEGRETHHAGCECHEARRDAEVAALRAEAERLRAENATLRKATDAAVDGVRAMLPAALEIARREGAEASAALCDRRAEAMTVDIDVLDQESAYHVWGRAKALRGAAAAIRALPLDAPEAGGES